ncbi:dTDP-4-dehydrorhamnose reductase [Edaphobacter acidisoli]|uniref:dTDP-4-dehydrorhamnose reductase n=1 Tax=Edaphobacter acidisoli TaxID=2040573 RepID=A0A916W9U2_9BACT|nr:dTDP-4-dehydrorhamnose reductase [Edaphobacter acidisoli]GGA79818.1 dTDP-4-dehydrorhamnose reductase [Edaphobacter acidisoli]
MAAAAPEAKILLTGSTGQVGGELLPRLSKFGEVVAPGRDAMDLANVASVREVIRAVRPRWIVNPAAYTAVDKAESEPELAYAINRDAVRVMGEEARAIGAGVIHFSTDYVFDGAGDRPYVETDATNPVSVYGASKLAGERALAESGAGHLIFRTSWVYGARGKNFLLTILRLAREREVVRVVADQHGAPTWSRDLAVMTAHAMSQCEAIGDVADVLVQLGGVYHTTSSGETTWHGFATEAVRLVREREPEVKLADLEAITTAEYPTPARRPANSRMNTSKLASCFGWRMADWRESLRKVVAEL